LIIVNKNTKIWLNYFVGAAISLLLLWNIYGQVTRQLASISPGAWRQTGPDLYLWLCIGLMFFNTSLEGYKWYLLTLSVEPIKYSQAFSSYLAGVAFSIITPNRIGEYPGRILYLERSNTFKYINVSILGIVSQLSTVYIFGMIGLIYYNFAFPAPLPKIALAACLIVNIFAAIIYWKFESWMPVIGRIKLLHKFSVYGKLLKKFSQTRQILILGISILRFTIFTAQYLFLLRWMNVNIPIPAGFCLVALFFWIMAVIPSITLTELGIRGEVSIFLFQHFSPNTVGMLAATAGIWLLNLIIPSILGSILVLRMRLLR
jgi:lysylphosphatidylglycerol synthase-like protein